MAFRSASTATYTFASGSTGSTVDLGANNNYRYINATNVYNKGKADADVTNGFSFLEITGTGANWSKYKVRIKNLDGTTYEQDGFTGGPNGTLTAYVNSNWKDVNNFIYVKDNGQNYQYGATIKTNDTLCAIASGRWYNVSSGYEFDVFAGNLDVIHRYVIIPNWLS